MRKLNKQRKIRRFLDRVFIEREFFLRANDRVRYLRVSSPVQKGAAAVVVLALAWVAFSSASFVFQDRQIAVRDSEIERQKLAYFDLLAEVSAYQNQFDRVILELEGSQTLLLSMLETGGDNQSQIATLKYKIKQWEAERARITMAREVLRERLRRFETDLARVASDDRSLQARVADMRTKLASTEAERTQVRAARELLGNRLRFVEQELTKTSSARDELQTTVARLESELSRSQAEREGLIGDREKLEGNIRVLERRIVSVDKDSTALKQTITNLDRSLQGTEKRAARLKSERDSYAAEVAMLEQQGAAASAERANLNQAVAELEIALDRSLDRGDQVGRERDFYETRATGLEVQLAVLDKDQTSLTESIGDLESTLGETLERGKKLSDERDGYRARSAFLEVQLSQVRDDQKTLVKRITERTQQSVETIEKTVTMTGVDLNNLLQTVELEGFRWAQGGPFIPSDFISETDPSYQLQVSVALLDLQMDRLEALQQVVGKLPLVAPLDSYRLTSAYGKRLDPINGRKAMHPGLDLAAPPRTPVLSTAPGKVIFAGWRGSYGRMVEIDHGLGIRTRYAHLRKILVRPGQELGHREKVGLVGSSGRSTGPHVHYEVTIEGKSRDPMKFLKAGKNVFKG